MRIAIIGGGAIGLLFAHYLNENHEVRVYIRNDSQLQKLRIKGLTIERKGILSNAPVNAFHFKEWKGKRI